MWGGGGGVVGLESFDVVFLNSLEKLRTRFLDVLLFPHEAISLLKMVNAIFNVPLFFLLDLSFSTAAEAQQQSKKLTGSSSIPIKIRGISRKSLDESKSYILSNESSPKRLS